MQLMSNQSLCNVVGRRKFVKLRRITWHSRRLKLNSEITSNNGRNLLCAALITGVLIVFIKFKFGFIFATSDDYVALFLTSGYYTGHPYAEVPFMNTLFMQLFCLLHMVSARIPWYGLYFLGIHWISATLFLYSVLTIGCHVKISKIWILLLAAELNIAMFLYPMHQMQFTTTAGMVGAASVILLLVVDWETLSRRENITLYCISVICLFLSYLQRSMSGLVSIAFWGLALCYHIATQKFINHCRIKPVIVHLVAALWLFAVLIGITRAANYYSTHYGENAEFIQSEYNSYRAEFQDFIRPNVTFDEVKDLAKSVGWDRDMWDMLYSLFFFDERWNYETVKQFVDTYHTMTSAGENSTQRSALEAVKNTVAFARNNDSILLLFVVQSLSMAVIAASFFRKPRQRWAEFLAGGAGFGASLLLNIYLSYSGRLILRSSLSVLIPGGCLMIGVMLVSLKKYAKEQQCDLPPEVLEKKEAVHKLGMGVFAGYLLVIGALVIPVYNSLEAGREGNAVLQRCVTTIEEYALQNPENIYINDFTFGSDPAAYYPFTVYTDPPTNLMRHGGWLVFLSAYEQQLELNGFDNFSAEDYLRDTVFYLTRDPKRNPKRNFYTLLRYLNHTFGNVYAETVEVLPDEVYVIQFRQLNSTGDTKLSPKQANSISSIIDNGVNRKNKAEPSSTVSAFYVASDGSLRTKATTPDAPLQYWVNTAE